MIPAAMEPLVQDIYEGIDVAPWAVRTIPPLVNAARLQDANYPAKRGRGLAATRPYGGMRMPSGRMVLPYQDAWMPQNEMINPVRIEPEQFSANNYSYYNTAFTSQFQPTPRIISSSGRFATIPVNYARGMYSYVNPNAGRFS